MKKRHLAATTILGPVFGLTLVVPLLAIVSNAYRTTDWQIPIEANIESMKLGLTTALLSTAVGFALALTLNHAPYHKIFDLFLLVPLTVPSIIHMTLLRLNSIPMSGIWEISIPLIFQTFPLAYFTARFTISRRSQQTIDMAYLYQKTYLARWNLYGKPLLRIVPIVFTFIYVIAISDPLTPTYAKNRTLNSARIIWISSTALQDDTLSAQTALLLTILPSIMVIIIMLRNRRIITHKDTKQTEEKPLSIIRQLPAIAIVTFIILLASTAIVHSKGNAPTNFLVIANTLWLAFLVSVCATGVAFVALQVRSTLTDLLFVWLLLTPGATLGAGFALAYSQLPAFTGDKGTLLIIFSYSTLAIPFTYLAGLFSTKVQFNSARGAIIHGVSPAYAYALSLRPRIRNDVTVALSVVTAISAVMVSPVAWVTTPSSPIVIPRLFRLLDGGDYQNALSISITMSILQIVLLIIARAGFSLTQKRGNK